MGLLDLGIGGDKTVDPDELGTGTLRDAAQTLTGRDLQLKQQECAAYGMEYSESAGKCQKIDSSEPSLDN